MRIGLLLAESRGGIGQHVASLVPRFLDAGHEVVVSRTTGYGRALRLRRRHGRRPGVGVARSATWCTRTATAPV